MRAQSPPRVANSETGLMQVYKPMVKAFATILGIYYVLISGAHLAVLHGQTAVIMSVLAGFTALIYLTLRLTIIQRATSMVTLEVMVFSLSALSIANITAHAHLTGDYSQFVYLLMFTFGVSLIGPSKRTVAAVYTLILATAAFLTATGPQSAIVNNVFTTVTAIGGGFAAGAFLHKTIRAQRAAATLANDLLKTVEKEGLRNQLLAAEANSANHAKADFLANMSHELRTPLNGVVGIAHALIATELTLRQREMVELIENSGQTLTRLLTDILDFSKIEAGKIDIERAPFNLRDEIDAASFLLQSRAAEKSLSFDVIYTDAATGWLEGDATRIKQVVTNLASNAIKFTHCGSVTVAIDWLPASDILELRVSDTGVGFDKEAGKRLFQRFMQADSSITRRFGGTGLGLAICRGLVDAMGGGMDWSSEVGSGSLFTVRLPAPLVNAPVAKEDASQHQPHNENITDRHVRILVAEDHETNQKVLKLILEPLGIDLVICENGAVAVEAFKTGIFDVILMDMQMPIMDGLAATVAIRALEVEGNLDRTPIIMLTANAMRQHKDAASQAGADIHVAKPFTPTSLIGAIEAVLSGELDDLEDGSANDVAA